MGARIRVALALATVVTALGSGPVRADERMVCGERDHLVSQLGEQYSESRAAVALTSVGQMVEVFASRTGSWTLLLTSPDGPSCIAAVGEAWQVLPLAELPKPRT